MAKSRKVVDKRKVKLGKDGEVQANPEAEAADVQPEEKSEETGVKERSAAEDMAGLPPMDVYALVKSFIGILGAHAWQWMGLIKNPITGRVEKDMAQAKVAIDSISALAKQLESKLDESDQRELKALLGDLQINYVQQSARESQGS